MRDCNFYRIFTSPIQFEVMNNSVQPISGADFVEIRCEALQCRLIFIHRGDAMTFRQEASCDRPSDATGSTGQNHNTSALGFVGPAHCRITAEVRL